MWIFKRNLCNSSAWDFAPAAKSVKERFKYKSFSPQYFSGITPYEKYCGFFRGQRVGVCAGTDPWLLPAKKPAKSALHCFAKNTEVQKWIRVI